jgi:hypothetical protein
MPYRVSFSLPVVSACSGKCKFRRIYFIILANADQPEIWIVSVSVFQKITPRHYNVEVLRVYPYIH